MIEKQSTGAEQFQLADGKKLSTLAELRDYLLMIPMSEFVAHVTNEKNDFANWIEHVFGEQTLAKKIRECASREQMVWVLDDVFAEQRMQNVLTDKEIRVEPRTLDLESDEKFTPYKPEIANTNERITAKYDQITKQLQDALNNTMPKDLEQRVEKLKTKYAETLAKISETRRSGKDALIPALVIRPFLSKLTYAQATRAEEDFRVAERILTETEAELREVQAKEEVNVKKEVLALAAKA